MPEEEKLTIEQYEKAMQKLQQDTYFAWRDLYRRLELTDMQVVKRAAQQKWGWIDRMRAFQCAYCAYQTDNTPGLEDPCESCPVCELCSERLGLPASDILARLAT